MHQFQLKDLLPEHNYQLQLIYQQSTILIDALGDPPIPPVETDELSKYKSSPFVYPAPPSVISTEVTAPPDTVTCAVAPSQFALDAADVFIQ